MSSSFISVAKKEDENNQSNKINTWFEKHDKDSMFYILKVSGR